MSRNSAEACAQDSFRFYHFRQAVASAGAVLFQDARERFVNQAVLQGKFVESLERHPILVPGSVRHAGAGLGQMFRRSRAESMWPDHDCGTRRRTFSVAPGRMLAWPGTDAANSKQGISRSDLRPAFASPP